MADTRWLSEDEQRTWRKLVEVVMKLPAALESQLQRDADITHFEYWVMALLSESPDGALKLSTLAGKANASLSRLSHLVTRLENKGWATRRPSEDGSRSMQAVLTDTGRTKVKESAPGHVDAVRALVFEGLTPDELAELDRACGHLLDRIVDAAPRLMR